MTNKKDVAVIKATSFLNPFFTMNALYRFILLIILSSIISLSDTKAQEITVMTYNIFHGEQNYNRGNSNLDLVAEVINKYNPDFVALQEVDSMTERSAAFHDNIPQDLVQVLAKKTNMYGFFGRAMYYDNGGYGEGILSRHPVKPVNYSLAFPEGGEERALLTVKHTFPNGQKVIFAGTHLCHEHQENRLSQSEEIVNILSSFEYPVIMGGDFNFRPNDPEYSKVTSSFNDAAVLFGNPQNTISFENPRSRIDYIFVSKDHEWRIKNVEVIQVNHSDHMPVLVTLEIKN